MVNVGVISDTHGLVRPEALDYLSDCSLIVHAGDIGIDRDMGDNPTGRLDHCASLGLAGITGMFALTQIVRLGMVLWFLCRHVGASCHNGRGGPDGLVVYRSLLPV